MTEHELQERFGAELVLPTAVDEKWACALSEIRAGGRPQSGHGRRRGARILLALAAAVAALCAGAAGVYLTSHGAMLEMFFGNETRPSIREKAAFNERGEQTLALPNEERVPMDGEQAEALVGEYISDGGYAWTIGEYILTVEEYLLDETAGTGRIYYTLERPGGVEGLTISPEDGEVWPNGEGVTVVFCVRKGDGNWWPVGERSYADLSRSTPDKLCIALSLAEGEDWKAEDGLTIEFRDLRLNENSGTHLDVSLVETLVLPGVKTLPSVQAFDGAGECRAVFSAVGLKLIDPPAPDGDSVRYLALRYADGTEYVVRDSEHNIRNSSYELGSSSGGYATYDAENHTFTEHPPAEVREETNQYCFNRLVDPRQVVSIVVDGEEYTVAH